VLKHAIQSKKKNYEKIFPENNHVEIKNNLIPYSCLPNNLKKFIQFSE
jgi:hypothetical protein